jgi:acyl transferase domain-containing protein/acyl carrier protein
MALVCESSDELRRLLAGDGAAGGAERSFRGRARAEVPKIAFVFSGQGCQWAGMGCELLESEPVFRGVFERCDAALRTLGGPSLLDLLGASDAEERLRETRLAQPAIFALQVALAALWRSWGVEPTAVVGHSLGEVTAAHVAGILDLPDALRVVQERAERMERTRGVGAMLSLAVSEEEAELLLHDLADRVSLAAVNGPRSVVLSGEREALETLRASLDDVHSRWVPVDYAFHSPPLEAASAELSRALAALRPGSAELAIASTVSGDFQDGRSFGAAHWGANLRRTVRFAAAVRTLVEKGCGAFLEIGGHPVLRGDLEQLAGADALVLGSLQRGKPQLRSLLSSLAKLYVRGHDVRWDALSQPQDRVVDLPTYPWQHRTHRIAPGAGGGARRRSPSRAAAHPLLGSPLHPAHQPGSCLWSSSLSLHVAPHLCDQLLLGNAVVAGGALVELALGAARARHRAGPLLLERLAFPTPLRLGPKECRSLQVSLEPLDAERSQLRVFSRPESADGAEWSRHLSCTVRAGRAGAELDLAALRAECERPVDLDAFYRDAAERGLAFGPRLRALREAWQGGDEHLARVEVPEAARWVSHLHTLHPAWIDALLQLACLASGPGAWSPRALGSVRFDPRAGPPAWAHFRRLPSAYPRRAGGEACLVDGAGRSVLDIRGLELEALDPVLAETPELFFDAVWEERAEGERPATESSRVAAGEWLIFEDRRGFGARLARELAETGARCVRVRAAERFARIDENRYALEPTDAAGFERLLDEAFGRAPAGIVHLWSIDGDAGPPAADAPEASERLCLGVARLVQALVRREDAAAPALWLATRGVHALGGRAAPDGLWQAPLWGLARSIAAEHPELRCRRVDLGSESDVSALAALLARDDPDDELALRSGTCHVRRLEARPIAFDATGAFREAPSEEPAPGAAAPPFRATASYLVSGGLGGLGAAFARWMVSEGARHLVLLGRRGSQTPGASEQVAELERAGARVHVAAADVACLDSLSEALRTLPGAFPPLRGVVHAAGAADHQMVFQLEGERLARVLAPKLRGGWNLHRATAHLELDLFVLVSSISTLLESPGLGAYAAANAFLDGLALHRRARGLPAASVRFGPWAEVGMAARNLERPGGFDGLRPLAPARGVAALGLLLRARPALSAVMDLDLPAWTRAYPRSAEHPLFSRLRSGALRAGGERGRWRHELAALPRAADRRRRLEERLRDEVSEILGLDAAQVDPSWPLADLGFDSLLTLELKNRLEAGTGMPLSAALMYGYPSIDQLVGALLHRMQLPGDSDAPADGDGTATAPSPRAVDDDLSRLLDDVHALSDDEAHALLSGAARGDAR